VINTTANAAKGARSPAALTASDGKYARVLK
jgi:hypothetical protein